ncbi:MAG: hypothetical protein ACHQNA_11865 [Acidimicrobiales bacterium]
MTEPGAALASAHDAIAAGVHIEDLTAGQLEALLEAKRQSDEAALPARRLAGLKSRRAKLAAQIAYLDQDIAAAEKEA